MIIMGRTKKVGSTGRFGARYGRGVKKVVKEVEMTQKKRYICPSCKRKAVKRLAPGIFKCKKCDNKFTGGAYTPGSE